jgi:hypothetical protein
MESTLVSLGIAHVGLHYKGADKYHSSEIREDEFMTAFEELLQKQKVCEMKCCLTLDIDNLL